jgi:hypothetical protein
MLTVQMKDGSFSFYTANLDPQHIQQIVFRVREDNTPEKRAKEKGIKFWSIDPSTSREIAIWYKDHTDLCPKCKVSYRPNGTCPECGRIH